VKSLVIGAIIAAAVTWGLPTIRARFASKPSVALAPDTAQATPQSQMTQAPRAPGGPGDRWLPLVRQLEEQLRQFKNTNQKKKD
jgi:hypothetical protein